MSPQTKRNKRPKGNSKAEFAGLPGNRQRKLYKSELVYPFAEIESSEGSRKMGSLGDFENMDPGEVRNHAHPC